MTCPGSRNMPLAEPRCRQEGSGPGVPALPTRVSCCLGQIKERSGGSPTLLFTPVSVRSMYQGWGLGVGGTGSVFPFECESLLSGVSLL